MPTDRLADAHLLPLLTGSILCWHGTAHTCFENSKTHCAQVSTLVWSTRQAAVLASGDEAGRIALWRLEATANLSVLMQFDAAAQGSISRLVFAQESGTAAVCCIQSCTKELPCLYKPIFASRIVYLYADQLYNKD